MAGPSMEIINTRNQNPNYMILGDAISLSVYPRLHMFTFDLSLISGILKHGSLGYSLLNMPIEICVQKSSEPKDSVAIFGNIKLKELDFKIDFDKMRSYIKSDDRYDVTVRIDRSIREHTGLGVSTQILGGVYLCSAKASGFELKINDLFKMGIGQYSALGLNLIFNPGMILEMGCRITDEAEGVRINSTISKEFETVSNTVIRVKSFPFYTIVAIPKTSTSISGKYEIDFWNESLPDKNQDSYRIIYNVLESIIPGIVENDFSTFTKALNENIKLGSKPLEEHVQSERTKEVLEALRKKFVFAAVSSLGPALYAFSQDDPGKVLSELDIRDYTFLVYDHNGNVKKKVNNGESLVIASFACMGKTTFAKQNPTLALDIESIHYARVYKDQHLDDEIAKGQTEWRDNPAYPMNYVQDLMDNLGKYKVIFLTGGKDILSILDEKRVNYSILYPGMSRKAKVLADARSRGNDDDFIALLDKLLSTPDHRLGFASLDYEKFEIIDDDRYMEDYLRENYYV